MRVAINLSAFQLRHDDIADRIAGALARHRIHPALLTCEITEIAAMKDTGATQEIFRRLANWARTRRSTTSAPASQASRSRVSCLLEFGCDQLQRYLVAKPMTTRALLLWTMDDRSTSAVFRDSLFGETGQASRQGATR